MAVAGGGSQRNSRVEGPFHFVAAHRRLPCSPPRRSHPLHHWGRWVTHVKVSRCLGAGLFAGAQHHCVLVRVCLAAQSSTP